MFGDGYKIAKKEYMIPKEYEMPTGLNSHLSIKDCSRVCQKSSY